MKLKNAFFIILAFILGVLSTILISQYTSPVLANPSYTTEQDGHFITKILGLNEEKHSPYDWVKENDIKVEDNRVIINVEGAQWSRFTDTNSMDPVIDYGTNTIQIVPKDQTDVHIGDIVSYIFGSSTIIHRVVETGYDDNGWYAIMKGDNNPNEDPSKVRFNQIQRITIAIIY
ncbi:MAG: hypothetical protein AABW92_05165 [Nanoarchaeota archaeon]